MADAVEVKPCLARVQTDSELIGAETPDVVSYYRFLSELGAGDRKKQMDWIETMMARTTQTI